LTIKSKNSYINTNLKTDILDGQEHLAMHRSGQGLFLPHARFKNKRSMQVAGMLYSA